MISQYIRTLRLSGFATGPVDLAQAKLHLRIGDESDVELPNMIAAATEAVEKFTNRFWSDGVVVMLFSGFPASSSALALPFPAVDSLIAVQYIESDGTPVAVPLGDVLLDGEFQEIYPVVGWPSGVEGVRIQANIVVPLVPAAISQAILLHITDMYENRGAQSPVNIYENKAAESLLTPYRVEMGV